jgi:hypothetical protein
MTRPVPGQLGYRARANFHRPRDSKLLEAEVRRMYRDGLSPGDIATALGIAIEQIKLILTEES